MNYRTTIPEWHTIPTVHQAEWVQMWVGIQTTAAPGLGGPWKCWCGLWRFE